MLSHPLLWNSLLYKCEDRHRLPSLDERHKCLRISLLLPLAQSWQQPYREGLLPYSCILHRQQGTLVLLSNLHLLLSQVHLPFLSSQDIRILHSLRQVASQAPAVCVDLP